MTIVRILLLSLSIAVVPIHTLFASSTQHKVTLKLDHGTDDLHSVFMALKIGKMLAERKQDVTLFLNLEAVRLVDKNQPINLKWGNTDQTIATLYDSYIKAGGKVLVCPHCAKVAGVEKMRKGAKIAKESEIAELFVNSDKVIDY